jgi:hypothetical protein
VTGSTPILEQLLNRLRLSGHSLIRRPVQLHAIVCLSICYWWPGDENVTQRMMVVTSHMLVVMALAQPLFFQ